MAIILSPQAAVARRWKPRPRSRSIVELSPDNRGAWAQSGEFVVEKADQQTEPGERQDAAGDAVQPHQVPLAEGFAEQASAETDAKPPDQRAEQYAGDEDGRAFQRCFFAGKADAGEDAQDGKDGERICDRQDEGREIGTEQILGILLELLRAHDAFAQRADTDIDEEEAAGRAHPLLIVEQEVRDDGQAKTGDDAEDRVGARRAEPGEKAEKPALENRAADAEHADGADRNGD